MAECSSGAAATARVARPVAVAVIHARPGSVERRAHPNVGRDSPKVTNPAVINHRVSAPTSASRLMASSIGEYGDAATAEPTTQAPMKPTGPMIPPSAAVLTGSRMATT